MMIANVQATPDTHIQPAVSFLSAAAVNEKQLAELALVRRVQQGDANAFYDLVRPYERAVFLAALGLVRNDADAEDVAQEAVLKAFKGLAHFRGDAKFSTWLIQIAINEAKMKLRKDRRHLYESIDEGQPAEDGDYIPRDFADWREIPSEALDRKGGRVGLQQMRINSIASSASTITEGGMRTNSSFLPLEAVSLIKQ